MNSIYDLRYKVFSKFRVAYLHDPINMSWSQGHEGAVVFDHTGLMNFLNKSNESILSSDENGWISVQDISKISSGGWISPRFVSFKGDGFFKINVPDGITRTINQGTVTEALMGMREANTIKQAQYWGEVLNQRLQGLNQ